MKLRTVLLLATLSLARGRAQQIAITFDDLPAHGPLPPAMTRLDVATSILATLKAEHMPPVYGFINGEAAEDQPTRDVLAAWRAAGQPLGNHTWSHPDLNHVSAASFEANIARNEPMLQQLMPNEDWHWFRFPYLHEGETLARRRAVRAWLADHGYRIAEVNMDFEDYLWNDSYARCAVRHNDAAIATLHDTYLATADEYIGVFRKFAQLVYGRDVKYILLLHIGAFDAKMLPELLELYRKRGFTFITLQQAEDDPAYKDDPDKASRGGGTQLEQMMDVKEIDYPPNSKPYKLLAHICR